MSAFRLPRRDDRAEADVLAYDEDLVDVELERQERDLEKQPASTDLLRPA